MDMTKGSPTSLLLRFAMPLFLGNLLQQFYNLVDTSIAGNLLGDGALAQIGATAALYSLITNFAFGMNNGLALGVSRNFGAGDQQGVKKSVCWMTCLSCFCSVVLTVAFLIFRKGLLQVMQIPDDVMDGALRYLTIILAGIPLTMLYNLEASLLQAVGNSVIENAGEDEVLLHILYVQEPDYELQNRIYLFQGLPKADKMELIIQKAVELGAYSVVPVSTRRCVVKLDNKKAEKKVSRWQQIAESAAKQSKRMLVPEVHSVMTFKEALVYAKELDVLLIPYELAKGMKETKELIRSIEPGKSIGVFIGPEGGFEEQEVADAMEAGAKPITLGHRILRTETAGLAVLSVLMFQLEDE